MAGRALTSRLPLALLSARSFLPRASASPLLLRLRLRPLSAVSFPRLPVGGAGGFGGPRCFSTRPTTSSLNDPSPNWSNRPPKETILLDGCDFEHWLVVVEPPDPSLTRDEIIDSYIKTLANVVGSEEEARMKIYSVSTKHYFAFGALVSEELSYKIKTLPKVRWVLPDSYLDVKNKDYGGEPFINGQAVPYDPKYHEEWVRNNARANERSRRNDRPRNFDRSRNFERRRENMQNFQNRDATPPPMPNQNFQGGGGQSPMPPRDMPPPVPNSQPQNAMPPRDMPPPPPMPNRDFNAMPPRDNPNMGGMPNRDAPPSAPYSGGMPNMPNRDYQNQMPNPQGSYGGFQGNPGFQPGQGYQGGGPGGGMPGGTGYQGGGPGYQGGSAGYPGGNTGFQGNNPGYQAGNPSFQGGSPANQGGGPSYQSNNPGGGYQGNSPSYPAAGSSYQGGNFQGGAPAYQGRDIPGRDPQ